jgi:pyridoxal biosynthesis lyase PdxS
MPAPRSELTPSLPQVGTLPVVSRCPGCVARPAGPQAELRDLMQRWGADGIALRFRPYDWTTNAVE